MYPNIETGGVKIIIPAPEFLDYLTTQLRLNNPIDHVALRDTPAGLPYIFIEDTDFPDYVDDLREFRDAWEADFSNPEGYGIGRDAWELTYKIGIK